MNLPFNSYELNMDFINVNKLNAKLCCSTN